GGYGLVAMLRNGDGPVILFRADMDALPIGEQTGLSFRSTVRAVNQAGEDVPVMHACGHDIHMTVLLGIARQMAADRAGWHGTLLLIAQPAEEIGAGARAMLDDGLFERFPLPDYNLAFHVSPDLPAGEIGYVSGYALANVDSVDIAIHGVGGHGAYPQKTIDPIVIAARTILALQTLVSRELSPLKSAVVTVGSIHGGTKHNIIPDEVRLQLTVRSYSDETRDFLLRRIGEISRGIAQSAGLPEDRLPELTIKDEYTPAVYNDPALIDRIVAVLESTLGEAAVAAVDPVMAGEDFARYGRTQAQIPGALLWLGAVNPERFQSARHTGDALPGLHSSRFAPDAGPTIATGVRAMQAVLLELFRERERRQP
ncbi:MAG TPA: amidohydrolase, partial [Gammaproteobacteria bacterium]|nr:amidohydrolase [Gammaproteobacteria bacterium]